MVKEVSDTRSVTQLLHDWNHGDQTALAALMPLVYQELHRLAAHYLRRENPAHTLQPTALVNEAYLRLVELQQMQWQNRAQFFGVAANFMRRILVDHARAKHAEKRGSGGERVSLTAAEDFSVRQDVNLLALDDALETLAQFDSQQCRVVELRFFAGLTIEEAAEVLGVSTMTVKRDWRTAKLWLQRELSKGEIRDADS